MKQEYETAKTTGKASLPIWERGLKRRNACCQAIPKVVAPYMGAWIETAIMSLYSVRFLVAPYMGAWIETTNAVFPNPVQAGRSLDGSMD